MHRRGGSEERATELNSVVSYRKADVTAGFPARQVSKTRQGIQVVATNRGKPQLQTAVDGS